MHVGSEIGREGAVEGVAVALEVEFEAGGVEDVAGGLVGEFLVVVFEEIELVAQDGVLEGVEM